MIAVEEDVEQIAYPIPRAAQLVGVSADSIRRAIRRGDLTARYPTSRPVILRRELIAWMESAPSEEPKS